ncbi:2-nitropropane dioxygenase [Zopfochytrium polystomum]|nr:2-nitropropane dioxygenase [Zopfochytrium polystomum]
MPESIQTPLTKLLGIQHPIILAGMNATSGPELVAAVSNAGGLGVFGGLGYTPKLFRESIAEIKRNLARKDLPFGVDLALPQVGGSARKTNYDYTHGTLPELIDIVVEEKASLFVSAVGVPPRWAIDKLHAAGIPVMNMIGSPKHVEKALEAGVDILCPQGGEGGGHTGEIATSVLIPAIVDMVRGRRSRLNGQPIYVVAAGGIYDGRGLAMALCLGAQAVWVGTRFVAAVEAGAPNRHKNAVVKAGVHDTIRTLIYSGRPLRTLYTAYVRNWEENRAEEIKALCAAGKVPFTVDVEALEKTDGDTAEFAAKAYPLLMGQVAGAIDEVLPAKVIVENMAREAVEVLRENERKTAKL